MINKVIEQTKANNYPEPLLFGAFPYKDLGIEMQLCEFRVKARDTTLRRILDRIALKGNIIYQVRRWHRKDGSVFISTLLLEKDRVGLSPVDPEPDRPCPKWTLEIGDTSIYVFP